MTRIGTSATPVRKVSMGDVWDRTAEFLSDNLGVVLPLALVAIFVPAVISGNFSDLQHGATPALAGALGQASLLLAMVSLWGHLAITALALDPDVGKGAGGIASRRFPAALLLMVVTLIATLLLMVPVPIILAANGVDLTTIAPGSMPQVPPGASLSIALYILVVLPVLLWVAARLSVLFPVVVGEHLALRAIARAWGLTRGLALKIVGVILLYAAVSLVANLAATTAFGAIMYLVAGHNGEGLSLATVLTTIVGGAVTTAFAVLSAAFTAHLFVALRAREAALKGQ